MIMPPPSEHETRPLSLVFNPQSINDLLNGKLDALDKVIDILDAKGKELAKVDFYSAIADDYKRVFGGDNYEQTGANLCLFAKNLRSPSTVPENSDNLLIELASIADSYSVIRKKRGPFSDEYIKY